MSFGGGVVVYVGIEGDGRTEYTPRKRKNPPPQAARLAAE
jgi:hypothetical protein